MKLNDESLRTANDLAVCVYQSYRALVNSESGSTSSVCTGELVPKAQRVFFPSTTRPLCNTWIESAAVIVLSRWVITSIVRL